MQGLLTTKEAAALLGMKPSTLRDWRCSRIGPPFIVLSPRNVKYSREDLERYIAERRMEPYVPSGVR
jgi:predicted DNA-binding transcriptional regulator AlpA